MSITLEELKEQFDYNPKKGQIYIKGSTEAVGYSRSKERPAKVAYINGRIYSIAYLVWAFHTGEFPQSSVYHISKDHQDDRMTNLSLTRSHKGKVRGKYENNSTGVAGVYPLKNKFVAYHRGKYLGLYASIKSAQKKIQSVVEGE